MTVICLSSVLYNNNNNNSTGSIFAPNELKVLKVFFINASVLNASVPLLAACWKGRFVNKANDQRVK